ncbi:hypothetical protein GNZ12_10670 [Paraburkholderia sp. 1N]|uniref:Uncharacterized protein n=1 Tax=Paraburkholderia solitsugae TaxID=2675748 RepID=A0ABX2BQF6_9BURK|nr:hypothetical protein [Paraburkholderia solitsugae]NPT41772.1 hypothetical protein [Paraburkholderia solitsugae]
MQGTDVESFTSYPAKAKDRRHVEPAACLANMLLLLSLLERFYFASSQDRECVGGLQMPRLSKRGVILVRAQRPSTAQGRRRSVQGAKVTGGLLMLQTARKPK